MNLVFAVLTAILLARNHLYVDPAQCRIALDPDPILCCIAQDYDPALCGIAQDQNGIARDNWIKL
jgi:hypothetical protein